MFSEQIYENERLISIETETLDMTEEQPGDGLRRHRILQRNYEETHISILFENNEIDQDLYLYDVNYDLSAALNK